MAAETQYVVRLEAEIHKGGRRRSRRHEFEHIPRELVEAIFDDDELWKAVIADVERKLARVPEERSFPEVIHHQVQGAGNRALEEELKALRAEVEQIKTEIDTLRRGLPPSAEK